MAEYRPTDMLDADYSPRAYSARMTTPLQAARERASITQEQLAKAVGVSQSTISRIEKGGAANPDLAADIAKAVGLSELEILYPDRFAA